MTAIRRPPFQGEDEMNLFVIEQNILHFEKLLRSPVSSEQRRTIESLLRRERDNLKDFEARAKAANDPVPPPGRQ